MTYNDLARPLGPAAANTDAASRPATNYIWRQFFSGTRNGNAASVPLRAPPAMQIRWS